MPCHHTRKIISWIYWSFHGKDGFYIGTALRHYLTFSVIAKDTKRQKFSDTVKFQHYYLEQPPLTPYYRIIHTFSILTCSISDEPVITCNS